MNEFKIDVGDLKKRTTPEPTKSEILKSDQIAEDHGFVSREPKKRRGRKPSPRTGQVHAKVMPDIAKEIANEARSRGVQQGVLIEEAWALYQKSKS